MDLYGFIIIIWEFLCYFLLRCRLYERHFGRVGVVNVAVDRFDAITTGAKHNVPIQKLAEMF